MSGLLDHGVPLDAVAKGRNFDAVLREYRRIWEGAKEAATSPGKTQDEIASDALAITAYRLYLLGVADGMQ